MSLKTVKGRKTWERTNVTNLLRNGQSGNYYARVKVNGKEKWRTLKTKVFSVAKLKLGDVERDERSKGMVAAAETLPQGGETTVERFINIYLVRTKNDPALRPATKVRRETAVKAILKIWRDLPLRDARRVTPTDCQHWAVSALREGTGFVAPKARLSARECRRQRSTNASIRCGPSSRSLGEHGVTYQNPVTGVSKAKVRQKRLELPSVAAFHAIVKNVSEAGARQSKDCADLVRFLAYSGARIKEANGVRWRDFDPENGRLAIAGTKSASSDRLIPIFPPLAELLKEIRGRRGDESGEAPVLRVRECKGALRSACMAAGVKPITHHDLRHLFATRCIESGVDLPTVSRWLGYADGGALAMRTYGHLRQEHSTAQAAKVHF